MIDTDTIEVPAVEEYTLSKMDKLKLFVKRHEVEFTAVAVAAVSIGTTNQLLKNNAKNVTRLREYGENLRTELGAVSVDHQTALEFIEHKNLVKQFEKFVAEQVAE